MNEHMENVAMAVTMLADIDPPNALRIVRAWAAESEGLSCVTLMTAKRFVDRHQPGEDLETRNDIAGVLFDYYCDTKLTARYDADVRAQNAGEV